MKTYYLAYGSNLSVAQMAERCRDAIYVGTGEIENYQLLFRGSKTGSYLTIEQKEGSKVPVLVWEISPQDERRLDRYEGYPSFYTKERMKIKVHPLLDDGMEKEVEAIVYVMHKDRELGCPTPHYYDICMEGYWRFHFDWDVLENAVIESIGKDEGRQFLDEFRDYR